MQKSIKSSLLRDLLPGLIPLFVFIVADEIWGTIIALYIAIVFGLAELLFTYLRSGKFEKFILFDIGLLTLLGLVSVLFNNDVFFKLKPVVLEGILLIIIGFSGYGRKNYILEMSGRYFKHVKLYPSATVKLNKSLRILFWIILAHIILVLFSVFFMSTRAWGFISGVLFYLLVLGYFAFEMLNAFIQNRKLKGEEVVPVVDENGAITGKAIRSALHFNPENKLLHPVVHLHVFNRKGEIYLQKRLNTKLIQPGKWDTAVGGHISWGETLEESLKRETFEEISLRDFKPVFTGKYIWETEAEKELVYMFITVTDNIPVFNPDEISEGKFWTIKVIEHNMNKGIFTPNLEKEIGLLRESGFFLN